MGGRVDHELVLVVGLVLPVRGQGLLGHVEDVPLREGGREGGEGGVSQVSLAQVCG
jgi:hypothetical protein